MRLTEDQRMELAVRMEVFLQDIILEAGGDTEDALDVIDTLSHQDPDTVEEAMEVVDDMSTGPLQMTPVAFLEDLEPEYDPTPLGDMEGMREGLIAE